MPKSSAHDVRLDDCFGASRDGFAERPPGVGDAQGDVLHPVAVKEGVATDRRAAADRTRDHETNLVLLEHVTGAVAHARLRPRVRRPAKTERVLVVVGGLLRVSHPELDVVPAVEGHEVVSHVTSESIPAVAGVPAAASAAETSSSERRSRCSWT